MANYIAFWISTKIYSGKYVELDKALIAEKYRSQGIGKQSATGLK